MYISLYKRHVYYRFRLSVMKLTVLFVISLCLIAFIQESLAEEVQAEQISLANTLREKRAPRWGGNHKRGRKIFGKRYHSKGRLSGKKW